MPATGGGARVQAARWGCQMDDGGRSRPAGRSSRGPQRPLPLHLPAFDSTCRRPLPLSRTLCRSPAAPLHQTLAAWLLLPSTRWRRTPSPSRLRSGPPVREAGCDPSGDGELHRGGGPLGPLASWARGLACARGMRCSGATSALIPGGGTAAAVAPVHASAPAARAPPGDASSLPAPAAQALTPPAPASPTCATCMPRPWTTRRPPPPWACASCTPASGTMAA